MELFIKFFLFFFSKACPERQSLTPNRWSQSKRLILFTLWGTMTPPCDCRECSERGGQSILSLASPLTYLTSYRKEISLENKTNIFIKPIFSLAAGWELVRSTHTAFSWAERGTHLVSVPRPLPGPRHQTWVLPIFFPPPQISHSHHKFLPFNRSLRYIAFLGIISSTYVLDFIFGHILGDLVSPILTSVYLSSIGTSPLAY